MPNQLDPRDIVRSRLGLPRAQASTVRRPRLEAALQRGSAGLFTLVCAPAGSGKSTLVGEWLRQQETPAAWLSLDEDDSELTTFVEYLVRAIQHAYANSCPQTATLLRSARDGDALPLASRLCTELNELPGPLLIVIDDYHVVRDHSVHQFIHELLRCLPNRVHLTIATRSDPPLPLARMRGRGQMFEIRGEDLRFNLEETVAMLGLRVGEPLGEGTIQRLQEETEGWAAGLHMASLSVQRHPNTAGAEELLAARANRHIMDYLLDEVLLNQPVAVQEFLMRSSMLDRFSAPLLAAVMALPPATDLPTLTLPSADSPDIAAQRELLRAVERSNLFLIPLDDVGEWYRYHHLFRDLLRRRFTLSVPHSEVSGLLARASQWFADNGSISDAIHYALAAGDSERAAGIVSDNIHPALNLDRRLELRRWLALLPGDLVQANPSLTLAEAWMALTNFDFSAMDRLVDRAEWLLNRAAETNPLVERARRAEVAAFRAFDALHSLRPAVCIEYSRQALANLPVEFSYMRGLCLLYQSFSLAMTGDPAIARSEAAARRAESVPGSPSEMLALTAILGLNWFDTNLDALRQVSMTLLEITRARHNAHIESYAIIGLGASAYEQNQIEEARLWFSQSPTPDRSSNLGVIIDCMAGAALCFLAQGNLDEAQALTDLAHTYSSLSHNRQIINVVAALQAEIARHAGDIERAMEYAARIDRLTPRFSARVLLPAVTRIRLRLLASNAESLQQIIDEVQEAERLYRTVIHRRELVAVLALKSIILNRCGHGDEAIDAIAESVTQGSTYGLQRVWLDLAPEIEAPLQLLVDSPRATPHARTAARQILGSIALLPTRLPRTINSVTRPPPATNLPHSSNLPPHNGPLPDGPLPDGPLPERLTPREEEVLAYLSQRLTDKEIAQVMVVSTTTVRTHIDNIFAKLSVTHRRDAVARARHFGLIPPSSQTP